MESTNNNTRQKLEEAQYFLKQMGDCLQDAGHSRYNLSAFLSACRSITDVMHKQYDKVSGFEDWYQTELSRMKDDTDLRFLKDCRDEAVHVQPVYLQVVAEARIGHSLNLIHAWEEPPPPTMETQSTGSGRVARRITGYQFVEYKNEDVIPFCERQLEKLRHLVNDCESTFLE